MRVVNYIFVFIGTFGILKAQQFPQYTQFIFNKIGYSPAASGTSPNSKYELIFGGRTQWVGLSNNPKSAFASFNYNILPARSIKKWHNVGAYIAQDQNGSFIHNDVWLSYTFHLFIAKGWLLSSGIFAGIKQYKLQRSLLDPNDPAVIASASSLIAWPDIIPGIRLTNRKFFIDLAVQHAAIWNQKGIGGEIGTPSKVRFNYNLSLGKKVKFNDFNNIVIATNIRGSLMSLPSVEVNIMNYYDKKIAFGASLRNIDFTCFIFQMRVLPNVSVGMAYDLSINRMLFAAPHTFEIMLSFSPLFGGELSTVTRRFNVDDCSF
ncbi:MAG: PorP/SprF family type IX secretion system membrane protein [Bacteroidetes bacterium]|nr:PorP/SprF family type IX secretion system membrane protein [Bacteroidota bacterium]